MLSRLNLFDYLDYRAFLRDFYLARKREQGKFSFRFFSKLVGLRSSNFLKLVMDGERNLQGETLHRLIKAMKLSKPAAASFAPCPRSAQRRSSW